MHQKVEKMKVFCKFQSLYAFLNVFFHKKFHRFQRKKLSKYSLAHISSIICLFSNTYVYFNFFTFWFPAEHLTSLYFNNTYTVAFHQVVSLNFCAVSKAIMPGKTVSECVRKLILQNTREKYSQRQISKMLVVPQATISNIISHYWKVGTLSPLRRPRRTPKTSQKRANLTEWSN